VPGLAHDGLSTRSLFGDSSLLSNSPAILLAASDGGRSNTRTSKLSASRAQTKASHKRARGKAPSWTPTRLRRLQAQHMHNDVPVVRKPPDTMARNQHGHSKAAWTGAGLARAGEHESLSGSLGEGMWLRATQEQDESRLEAVEAKRPLTRLARPSATFPQKRLSRQDGPGFSPGALY